jgi:hypothetical protein
MVGMGRRNGWERESTASESLESVCAKDIIEQTIMMMLIRNIRNSFSPKFNFKNI